MYSGLTNTGETYHRIKKVIKDQIETMFKFYMDDMIVEPEKEVDHIIHFKEVLSQVRKQHET